MGVNQDELLKQRADLQNRYDEASDKYMISKGGDKRRAKKVMNELEDQLKRIDKLIYDSNLGNQGIGAKTNRIDSVGSTVSDSIGSISNAISSVYGGQFVYKLFCKSIQVSFYFFVVAVVFLLEIINIFQVPVF